MNNNNKHNPEQKKTVALFATCLVDLMRPSVGFSAAWLLQEAGYKVAVPKAQTCCGQPAMNAGNKSGAADVARGAIRALEPYEIVVVPSGSCAGTIRQHWPGLFEHDPDWKKRAEAISLKTFELTEFLSDIAGYEPNPHTRYKNRKIIYQDSCSCLRDVGVKSQPRRLLRSLTGQEPQEAEKPDECCGFGGLFSVKYGDISAKITEKKVADLISNDPDLLTGADLGCLMSLKGSLSRQGIRLEVRHIAELLAGSDKPAIGEGPNTNNGPDEGRQE